MVVFQSENGTMSNNVWETMTQTVKEKQAWPVREASSEPFKCEYTRRDSCTSGITFLKGNEAPDSAVHVHVIR
jgi:hypothetical protein